MSVHKVEAICRRQSSLQECWLNQASFDNFVETWNQLGFRYLSSHGLGPNLYSKLKLSKLLYTSYESRHSLVLM
jgi:hypothetical protein